MDSSTEEESYDEVEIQKTLVSIRDLTLKIQSELDNINDLIKHNGQLHMVINGANEKLSSTAEKMGINVKDVVTINEHSHEPQINLPRLHLSESFKERLLAFASD